MQSVWSAFFDIEKAEKYREWSIRGWTMENHQHRKPPQGSSSYGWHVKESLFSCPGSIPKGRISMKLMKFKLHEVNLP